MIEKINKKMYHHVLTEKELMVHFQPIVSISKRKIIGVESLLRASYFGELISPESLFAYARERKSVIMLDHICQKRALQAYLENKLDTLLFINIETSLLEYYLQHSAVIIKSIDYLKLPRNKIVIEINEKRANNDSQLVELVNICKKAGFAIALDDVGAGYSNLNRIVLARPDIIKVDRSVISHIDENYYKQEVLRAITNLGQKIGAITIVEGAEKESEAVICVNCGVDWFQGYYFAKAMEVSKISCQSFSEKCKKVSKHYQKKFMEEMNTLLLLQKQREKLFNELLTYMEKNELHSMEEKIALFLENTNQIECAYVMDEHGRQITDTIFHADSKYKNQEMFSPMSKGDFHISKPFYNYAVQKKNQLYVSAQYISQATGNYCQTLSKYVIISEKITYILCVDFIVVDSI